MLKIKKMSSSMKKLQQLKIDRAKFILSTYRIIHNKTENIVKDTIAIKRQKYTSSQYQVNQQQQQQQQQKFKKSTQQTILMFKPNLPHSVYYLVPRIVKALLNLPKTDITMYHSYQIQQNQRLQQIKASTTKTTPTTPNQIRCQNKSINTRKLSHISDSDFFIFKAESCANHLSNFITLFINKINSFVIYFSFHLNTTLNGIRSEDILRESAFILADNNININNIYSVKTFGANFLSKYLRNKNIVGNRTFSNSDINFKSNIIMSKVATEQPPIDICKGNINNDTTKDLAVCTSRSDTDGIDIGIPSTSSSSEKQQPNVNNLDKKEKEPCFKSNLGDIIKFLELVGGLKHTKRTGFVLRDVENCESISGHMYRMAMMTFLLDGTEGLNQTKCMELALVHDLAECIVGDLTPFCGVTKEDKKRMEMEAMEKICKLIEPRGKRMWELFVEYEGGESPESKFVKDLDRLDMVLQAFEYEKRDDCVMKHQEFFDSTEGKFEHNFVQKLVKEIYDQRDKLAIERGCTTETYPKPPSIIQQNGNHINGDVKLTTENRIEKSTSTTEENVVVETTATTLNNETETATGNDDLSQKTLSNGR